MKKISLSLIFSFFAVCFAFGQSPSGNPDLLKGNIVVPDFRFQPATFSKIESYNNQGSIHWNNSATNNVRFYFVPEVKSKVVIYKNNESSDIVKELERRNLVNYNRSKALLP